MSKDRLVPCKFYVSHGHCEKNRNADYSKYCQRCNKYTARNNEHHVNKKKKILEKLQKEDMDIDF